MIIETYNDTIYKYNVIGYMPYNFVLLNLISMKALYKKYKLGDHILKNRIVMPPMTRSRALKADVANPISAEYYAQRASAGLIITEGTQVSQQGKGYAWTPGIYSEAQTQAWKTITDEVHEVNGIIFAQLWHVGRVSHTSLQVNGKAPVSSSELVADGVQVYIDPENKGQESGAGQMVQHSKPIALTKEGINDVVEQFRNATRNAIKAGFDGVEIHAANGYLINQFIDSQANNRNDEYGGSIENRIRFLIEVTEAVVNIMGNDKVGVRLAPLTTLQGTVDDTPEQTYMEAIKALERLGILYVHIAEADWDDAPLMPISFKKNIRQAFTGTTIYSGKYDKQKAEKAIEEGWADMIGFGRAFIANPDLPYRLQNDLPLNTPNKDTFFGGGANGLTDYPFYNKKD